MNNKFKRMLNLAGIINESTENTTHSSSGFIYGNYNTSMIFKHELEDIQKDYPELKFYVEFDNSHIRRDKDIIKYSYSFPLNNDNGSLESILEDIIKHFESPQYQNESTIISKNTDSSQIPAIAAREKTDNNTVQQAINQAKQSGKPININETSNNKMKKSQFKEFLKEEIRATLSPQQPLKEMAAIKGDIKTKVDQIIADNPDMEVGPLARLIMKDEDINAIIDRDNLSDMAQNQTQKYIRLARGERELQQRGRKADPNKPASSPKTPKAQTGPSREELIHDLEQTTLEGDDAKWAGKLDKLSTSALKNIHKNYFSDDVNDFVDVEAETGNTPPSGGTLNEMAKITGDLADAIGAVIASAGNDLDGLALKKAIKADPDVIQALGGDTLYDNQLNKFIALAKGERELKQRGRKADPDKQASEPKAQKPKTEKPSLVDLVDDDEVDIEDTWSKPDTDFDDDFDEDKVKDVEVEENPSLEKERVQTLKDQETKKFWKNFVSQMKEKGVIGNDNKPLDKEKLDKERKSAQKLLSMKLKTLK